MKIKKLVLAASSILAIGALTGCSGGSDLVDEDYELGNPGTLAAGFTSLANTNANGAIDADGYYTAGGLKFKVKDELNTTYVTEPTKDLFNYLTNQWTYNSYHYCNMVDGLVENDKYGNIVGAIALGYKITDNADGTQTWTFQLRENAEWVNNKTGKKVANVTAQDFVTSAKYVLNPANGSATTNLYFGFINGSKEYYDSLADSEAEDLPFSSVGVKAVSDYVLEYTLYEPTPYFYTALTYSPYLPVYEEFLNEEGTEFGKTVDDILVNGAFRVTTHNPNNLIRYAKNYHYYDRDHVYVKHVNRKYLDSALPKSTAREWYEAGLIDSFNVNSKDETGFNVYVKGPDGTGTIKNPYDTNTNGIQSYYTATFFGYFNYNRTTYEYTDPNTTRTDAQRKSTINAVYNRNFRLGFLYGMDAASGLEWREPANPENWVVRNFVNKELVSAGGKDFTDYVNDVYNEKKGLVGEDKVSLIGIDNGSDPIFSTDVAHEYFVAAKAELDSVSGIEYPIVVDIIGDRDPEIQVYNEAMMRPIEESSKIGATQLVDINWVIPTSDDQETNWFSVSMNFDFSLSTGWGPDYADPNTYAVTLIRFGDEMEYFCLPTTQKELDEIKDEDLNQFFPFEGATAKEKMENALDELLGEYEALYEAANAVKDATQIVERYEKFALAEYNAIYESALIAPWFTANGYTASVAKTIPWQAGRASYGLTSDKYKNVIAVVDPISKTQRKAVTDEYESGK